MSTVRRKLLHKQRDAVYAGANFHARGRNLTEKHDLTVTTTIATGDPAPGGERVGQCAWPGR